MESILNTVKSHIPIYAEESDDFDNDIIGHINTAFSQLGRLGVKPSTFVIEDEHTVWSDYIPDDQYLLNLVKSYIKFKVKLMFDPPTSSSVLESTNALIKELEFDINTYCDSKEWNTNEEVENE